METHTLRSTSPLPNDQSVSQPYPCILLWRFTLTYLDYLDYLDYLRPSPLPYLVFLLPRPLLHPFSTFPLKPCQSLSTAWATLTGRLAPLRLGITVTAPPTTLPNRIAFP